MYMEILFLFINIYIWQTMKTYDKLDEMAGMKQWSKCDASGMALYIAMPVCLLVRHFGPDLNSY